MAQQQTLASFATALPLSSDVIVALAGRTRLSRASHPHHQPRSRAMALLVLRTLIFVVVLPAAVLVYIPNRILAASSALPSFDLGWFRLIGWVRNPMYVALVIVLLGESVAFQSLALLAYTGLVWLACHLFVVLYEEPALHRRFGAAYDTYRGQVPRWLPRLRRSGDGTGMTEAPGRPPPRGQT